MVDSSTVSGHVSSTLRCRLHPNKAFGFEAQLQEKCTVTLAEDSFLAEAFQEGSPERGQSTIGSPILPGPAGLSPIHT